MTENDKLSSLFTIMSKIGWINTERYRNGILGLLAECNKVDEFDVVEHVLTNLKFCTSNDLESAATSAAHIIQNVWTLDPSNTILVGLAEQNKTCGSSAYVRAIENKLPRNWESRVFTTFVSAFRKRDESINLIIVDDFIGTGTKVKTRIERIRNNPKTSSYVIYVISFASMNTGFSSVASEVDNRIHNDIYLDKCISNYNPPDSIKTLTSSMQSLETQIFNKANEYNFGYQQSEAAFFLESANIPNNNFPILWWEKYADNTPRATLFSRR